MTTIHSKEKTYEGLFTCIKGLETDIARQFDSKYQTRIHELERENRLLKASFEEYRSFMTANVITHVEESKDTLTRTLRKETEHLLNKELPRKQDEHITTFEDKELH